jgi:ABC-2 type transport system permease protein
MTALSGTSAEGAVVRTRSDWLRGGDVRHVLRVETRKLSAQLPVRLLAVAALLGPFAFALALKLVATNPSDTLFGMWVHSSGFALPLVVLSFAGAWGFPVIGAVVAGDIFASEDRHGTWKTTLTRACSRGDLFAGKVLAAATFAVSLALVAGVASMAAGVLLMGTSPLVGLSGQVIAPWTAFAATLVSWVLSVPPLLAFTALAILFSVSSRNGIVGVVGPVLVALVMQLLALVGNGVWVHQLLALAAFDDWHGLFADPRFLAPLAVGTLVSLAWLAACLGLAWRLMRARDFAGADGSRTGWRRATGIVVAGIAAVAAVAAIADLTPTAVTPKRLETSIKPAFNRLTLLQQRLLGRTIVTGAKLNDTAVCARQGSSKKGAGSDWGCTLEVLTPQASTSTPNFEPVDYDVSVKNNGCWSAEGPPSFVGAQTFRSISGATVVNPLFELEGCFNPLSP